MLCKRAGQAAQHAHKVKAALVSRGAGQAAQGPGQAEAYASEQDTVDMQRRRDSRG